MDPFGSTLPPDEAMELSLLSRLMYESREHRRMVLDAAGVSHEQDLLDRISRGDTAEHPGYEHYLAARILGDTQQAARNVMTELLKGASR